MGMKNTVFRDLTPYRCCMMRRFGGTYCLYLHVTKICERGTSASRWQRSAHAGSSLVACYSSKIEAIRSSETTVHTRSTRRHISEDGILHSHRCENLKSYKRRYVWLFEVHHTHQMSSCTECFKHDFWALSDDI
jgi:hypothetical protein